jgi:hypothetical protein
MKKPLLVPYAIIMLCVALSGGMLLQTSQRVQHSEAEVLRLARAIEREKQSIQVLQAEWAHLNAPYRLEKLAQNYLGMVPAASGQILVDARILPEEVTPLEAGLDGDAMIEERGENDYAAALAAEQNEGERGGASVNAAAQEASELRPAPKPSGQAVSYAAPSLPRASNAMNVNNVTNASDAPDFSAVLERAVIGVE